MCGFSLYFRVSEAKAILYIFGGGLSPAATGSRCCQHNNKARSLWWPSSLSSKKSLRRPEKTLASFSRLSSSTTRICPFFRLFALRLSSYGGAGRDGGQLNGATFYRRNPFLG
jgi:hypothetical protein